MDEKDPTPKEPETEAKATEQPDQSEHVVKVILPPEHEHHSHCKHDITRDEKKKWDCPLDEEELEVTNEKVQSLDAVIHNTHITSLSLRQNEISSLEQLSQEDHPLQKLQDLNLYGNKLTNTEHLHNLSHLTALDLSFNEVRDVTSLNNLTKLNTLYLCNNKINEMKGCEELVNLDLLEYGSNRIREIKGLEKLTNLKQLWLGRNKITEITGLSMQRSLEKMSIQSNRLLSMGTGLAHCTQLTELYLSHNGITSTTGLVGLVNLQILDLGNNQIEHVEGMETLTSLEELWISANKLTDVSELSCIKSKLNVIYLEHNPLAQAAGYYTSVHAMFPDLTQIDADYIEDLQRVGKLPCNADEDDDTSDKPCLDE